MSQSQFLHYSYIFLQHQESATWERDLKIQNLQMKRAYQQSKANEMLMQTHFSDMFRNIERSLSPSLSLESVSKTQSLPPSSPELSSSSQRSVHTLSPTMPSSLPINPCHSDSSVRTTPSRFENAGGSKCPENTCSPVTSKIPSPSYGTSDKRGKQVKKQKTNQNSLTPIPEVHLAPLSMSAVMKTSKVVVSHSN